MSDQYDNRHHGVLFKNDHKQTEKQPDYKGTYTGPDGVEWELAAWLRTSRSGKRFMSLKTSEKRVQKPTSGDYRADPKQQAQDFQRRHEGPQDGPPADDPRFDPERPF